METILKCKKTCKSIYGKQIFIKNLSYVFFINNEKNILFAKISNTNIISGFVTQLVDVRNFDL